MLEPEPCPACRTETYTIKEYEFIHLTLVFLLIAAHYSYRTEFVHACPGCMRRTLWRWNLKSMFTANIAWPIVVLPLFASRLIGTWLPWSCVGKPPWWKRTIGFLGVLGCAAAAVTVVFAVLSLFLGNPQFRPQTFQIIAAAIAVFPLFALIAAVVDF